MPNERSALDARPGALFRYRSSLAGAPVRAGVKRLAIRHGESTFSLSDDYDHPLLRVRKGRPGPRQQSPS
jgi:hypothetical protein